MINVVSRDRLRNLADFLLPVLLMAAILSATSPLSLPRGDRHRRGRCA